MQCQVVSSSGGIPDECDELLQKSRCTSERCVAECAVWQATAIVRRTDKVRQNVVSGIVQYGTIRQVPYHTYKMRDYLSVSFPRKYEKKTKDQQFDDDW